jgi:hypothetical protein
MFSLGWMGSGVVEGSRDHVDRDREGEEGHQRSSSGQHQPSMAGTAKQQQRAMAGPAKMRQAATIGQPSPRAALRTAGKRSAGKLDTWSR